MIVEHEILYGKTQTKMMDCWWASIQIIKSATLGAKTKCSGPAATAHRNIACIGRKLSFAGEVGAQVLAENQLVDISGRIRMDTVTTLATALQTYGPVIVGGKFAFFNTQGHCIVISGVNTDTGVVNIYDPAWGKGRQSKSWDYIARNCSRMMGDENVPDIGTFVANQAAGNAPEVRARR